MHTITPSSYLPAETEAFYRAAIKVIQDAGVQFLVGGAYALGHYTGIVRHTKDFDIFLRKDDAERALSALGAAGYTTDLTFPHWLGKAFASGRDDFIDIIYSSGNGVAVVDEEWFEHAALGEVFGMKMMLCPAEEMIWSKGFIIERERYDGADIAHLIRALGGRMDWARLLRRFDRNWRVLLSHLVLFGYIYPAERAAIPTWVMKELLDRMKRELSADPPAGKVCQGTLISRQQYLTDIHQWGYEDARLRDDVHMTAADIAHWTAAIDGEAKGNGEHKIDAQASGSR